MSDYDRPVSRAAKPLVNDAGGEAATLRSGLKYDDNKPALALVPARALEEEGKVWAFGAKKYAAWNWSKGLTYIRVLSGVLRHIFAFLRGEDLDPESGLSHLAHARCGLAMVEEFRQDNRADLDDRRPKEKV